MGRPSLTEQRTAEILDAFERCVGRYGIAGATLEIVAAEADMTRSLVRHHVGNRDEMVVALAARVMAKYGEVRDAAFEAIADSTAIKPLVDYLLNSSPSSDTASVMVIEALIAASDDYPVVRALVTEYVETLTLRISGYLQRIYPQAPRKRCWIIAYGILGICFNEHSLMPLSLQPKFSGASRDSVILLIESLESS